MCNEYIRKAQSQKGFMGADFPTFPAPWNLDMDIKGEGQDSSILSRRGLKSLWRSLSQNKERQGGTHLHPV